MDKNMTTTVQSVSFVSFSHLMRDIDMIQQISLRNTMRAYISWGDVRHSLILAQDMLDNFIATPQTDDERLVYSRLVDVANRNLFVCLET